MIPWCAEHAKYRQWTGSSGLAMNCRVTCSVPSVKLDQCWPFVKTTIGKNGTFIRVEICFRYLNHCLTIVNWTNFGDIIIKLFNHSFMESHLANVVYEIPAQRHGHKNHVLQKGWYLGLYLTKINDIYKYNASSKITYNLKNRHSYFDIIQYLVYMLTLYIYQWVSHKKSWCCLDNINRSMRISTAAYNHVN